MPAAPHTALNAAILKIMRPLVRLLLRNGLAYADFALLVKGVFVEIASEDFDLPGRKQSVSRVSVLTGINRKEVKRLMELAQEGHETGNSNNNGNNNRAARVVSGWMRDSQFLDANGKPNKLPLATTDERPGFDQLVKTYSGDMPARSILDELVRVGAAVVQNGQIELTSTGYVPSTSNDELLRLSGESVSDLLNTVEYNLHEDHTVSKLQLSVAYDDVPRAGVDLFRNLSREKSLELLTYLDHFLATQDRTANPSVNGDGRYRTGVGVYYFEEEIEPCHESCREQSDSDTQKIPPANTLDETRKR